MEAYTGSEVTVAKTIKSNLKTCSNIDSAAKSVRPLVLGQMQLDMAKWQPKQRKLQV